MGLTCGGAALARRVGALVCSLIVAATAAGQDDPHVLTYSGDLGPADGPGRGRTVVLISGDEEYRGEEALPMLGRILAVRHGFTCHVLFAIDADTGLINPDNRTNIPGLERLTGADLMVIATRFRDLPDEQMAHIDRYVQSGRPIVGIRTATHAFNLSADSGYRQYQWNTGDAPWPQGFGRHILGETWIAHHGAHGSQATRGRIAPGVEETEGAAIIRGLTGPDVFGPTDVYRVRLPLPEGCTPVVLGEVVDGMSPDDPAVQGSQNDPMMPIAWTRTTRNGVSADAPAPRRVFVSTIGASQDFEFAGTRRLLINGAFWALGLEAAIPPTGTDVRLVGDYRPTKYGFGTFTRGMRPADFAWPPPPIPEPRGGPARLEAGAAVPLPPDARIVVMGGGFAERLAQSGWLDTVIHATQPAARPVIRHVPWSGDEVGRRPRETGVPTPLAWVDRLDADVVLLAFGSSEAFAGPAGLDAFERELRDLVDRVRRAGGADGRPPRPVLVSPVAAGDVGAPWPTGDAVTARQADLAAYTTAMERVATDLGVPFVDLCRPDDVDRPLGRWATRDGIHPTEAGCALHAVRIGRALGWADDALHGAALAAARDTVTPLDIDDPSRPIVVGPDHADGTDTAISILRDLAVDTHYHWRLVYRPTNTEYVWGRRAKPFGVVNFPPEMAHLEVMITTRERRTRAVAENTDPAELRASLATAIAAEIRRSRRVPAGARRLDAWRFSLVPSIGSFQEDAWDPPAVEARGTETSLGSTDIKHPDAFAASFTVAPGYVVECFASEQDFAELANPLAMQFDERGRLWVLCAPTYPHLLPGAMAESKLLILEDTDGDGRADQRTVFADRLLTPTGFALDGDTVYIGEAPDLLRCTDLDGDDVADVREIVASGFGMPDSHHQISAFTWDPAGGLMMHEGVFTISAVETPWGTHRIRDAATWRYDPRTERMQVMSHSGFSNPWGHAFDDFGQSVLADASGGANFSFNQVISAYDWPRKPNRPGQFLNRGRPTAGCELLHGAHFPPEVHGTFVVNQSIGFHGVRWERVVMDEAGSGFRRTNRPDETLPPNLIESSDLNFRPVAMRQGPDGALYIVDWCNPIIGHMQYSVRDPRRDARHGRIWRIRHATRDLAPFDPPSAADVRTDRITERLGALRSPQRVVRENARRALQRLGRTATATAIDAAFARLASPAADMDRDRERMLLEMLWIRHAQGVADPDVLRIAAARPEPRVRAAVTRLVRHQLQDGTIAASDALDLLTAAARDSDMRVRLEATVAAGFVPRDVRGAAEGVVAEAALGPMDEPMYTVVDATLAHLATGRTGAARAGIVRQLQLFRQPADELATAELDADVATVRIARDDVAREARLAGLDHLVGMAENVDVDPATRAGVLLNAHAAARRPGAPDAIGDLLLSLEAADLRAAESALDAAVRTAPAASRRLAVAAKLRAGLESRLRIGDAASGAGRAVHVSGLVGGLLRLSPAESASDATRAAVSRVRTAVERGTVRPDRAIAAIARHDQSPETRAWLATVARPAAERPLDAWDADHVTAMAALGALDTMSRPTTPQMTERLRRGAELYHDVELGCARCHAADGLGLEGYPALRHSPWLLGDPQRAAGIVVHGLGGRLEMPGGRVFNAAMAPLGATLNDDQIADVLTYARRSWGNHDRPVTATDVAAARAVLPPRGMWTPDDIDDRWPMAGDRLVDGVHPEVAALVAEDQGPGARRSN